MALGTDSAGMLARLRSLIPGGWISDFSLYTAQNRPLAPVANAVLGGLADGLAWVRAQGMTVRAGTRRADTTGWLLDVDAFGFFGPRFLRRPNESDASWLARYTAEIFRPRVTRAAIDRALYDLTGRHPVILEMWNTGDVGGYGAPNLAYGGGNPVAPRVGGYGSTGGGYGRGAEGYGVRSNPITARPGAGRWGSLSYPYQVFITAFRPQSPSIPLVAGYGSPVGGYGIGTITYADISQEQSLVSDAEIYATVHRTVGAGVTAWVAIQN